MESVELTPCFNFNPDQVEPFQLIGGLLVTVFVCLIVNDAKILYGHTLIDHVLRVLFEFRSISQFLKLFLVLFLVIAALVLC